jgi:acetyl-CoA C-acetyltransferase
LMEEVAVVGWAQTRHERAKTADTQQSMIFDVVTRALRSCSMTIRDIDVVVDAGSDFLDGRSTSNCATVDAMGAHFKEESKVAGDGLLAAIYAHLRVASGLFSSALVVAYGKSSEGSLLDQTRAMADPFYLRPLGLDALSAGALQARAYMEHYGVADEAPAKVAVKNRSAGAANPNAQLRHPESLDEVLSNGYLVAPIRRLEACPVTDGACAVVLVDWATAQTLGVRPAWITGVGHTQDAYYPGSRELHRAASSRRASRRAREMAGIFDPFAELDVIELTEYYAYQELMLYEALGLCGDGEGAELLDSGETAQGGRTPVNPSGGALCANPLVATGLVWLAEAAAQVSNRAGDLQVDGAERALAHATGGFAMQSAATMVLERKRQ